MLTSVSLTARLAVRAMVGPMTFEEAPWRRRFRAARITLPSWARDAPDRLLYASNAGGKWEIYAWDRTLDRHRQVTDRAEGTMAGTLDPAGRRIWWFDDQAGDEFGRWMVEPFEGGDRRPAAPDVPPAYSVGLAIGRDFAVIGSSTNDGTAVHVTRDGDPPDLIYRHREEAGVAGLTRDEQLVCLSHSEHGDSLHPALRILDLDGKPHAELWDGPGKGLWASGWSRVPGDQRLLVVHERQDRHRPLIWDVSTGDVTEIHLDLAGEVGASWYPDASALLIFHDHRGRTELYRFDLATGALELLPIESGTIAGARVHPEGEIWYAWSAAPTPPEVRSDGQLLIRPPGERAPEGVAYSDHEVGRIHVLVAEPERAKRPLPAIFLIHGGPHYHDRDEFNPRVQAWADHGFAVVLINYRGSTGYGRSWRDALQGKPGLTELEDIARVHDALAGEGLIDRSRCILAGTSWGGYLTLLGLGTQPKRWSLGIAAVPVADYPTAFEDEMEPLKSFDRALFGGSPEELPDLYRERSPMTYIDRVAVPVMILAGLNDPRCPIRQIENYIAKLEELGKPHEVYRYEAGHGSLVVDESIRQLEIQIAFASKHLGTSPPN